MGGADTGADRSLGLVGLALGLVAGGVLGGGAWSALSGAAIGTALGLWRAASHRAARFESALDRLEQRVAAVEASGVATDGPRTAPEETPDQAPSSPASAPIRPLVERTPPQAAASQTPDGPPRAVEIADSAHYRPTEPPRSLADEAVAALRGFFLGGNTVVRVGVLVLLIGVVLLAKWAADHALFPIEARLAVAAAIGVALAGIGFRLREARPGFATTLQGGGVAALYLVVFFAYRFYELVPAALAFALFVAIAIACGTLAIVQRSQPLIVIGSIGGFLAPVLASSGRGDHVVLFGYYLLLDLAIAAVAWRESWRLLNLVAFVCTYGVATAWGVLRYRPEHFVSTEPFLLAFLVLFTAVALVQAWRRPPRLAGLVDGTLVFGTPLLTLLAQAQLVEGRQLGMALSTAGFGLYYALLATWVWRRAPAALRRMAEAFVALAVVFATLAIPLALDDALTTTLAWSLEGAGVYWVGARQQRRLPRIAGLALQLLGALAFGWAALGGFETRRSDFLVLANPRFLSCAAIGAAGWIIAREAYAQRAGLARREWRATQLLVGWSLAWWTAGVLAEIDQFAPRRFEVTAALLALAATYPGLELAAARLRWTPGRLWATAVIPAAFGGIALSLEHQAHLLASGGYFAWPLVILATYTILRRLEELDVAWTRVAYAPAAWLVGLALALGLAGFAESGLALRGDWAPAAFGLGLAMVVLGAGSAGDAGFGPFGRFERVHRGAGVGPLVVLGLVWVLALSLGARGNAAPLPYLPFANPADVAIALLLLAALDAWARLRRSEPVLLPGPWRRLVGPVLAGAAFVWLNGLLARSAHQWTGVAFTRDALWESTAFQASLSISWTLVALGGMLWCTRRGWRSRWIASSTLLGITVVKLFLVDLSTLSTVARIGTFLVVGVLLLVVGYLSPVPPAREAGGERGGASRA